MKYFSVLLIVFVVLSCNKQKATINLSTFTLSEIPDELAGCSCAFSKSKEDYESEKFIYFDDLGYTCLLSIDNTLVFLKGEKDQYKNEVYTAFIQNSIQIDEGYESTTYTAELVIKDAKGNEQVVPVYGLCGC